MNKNTLKYIVVILLFITFISQLGCKSDTLKEQNIKSLDVATLHKEIEIDSFKISISSAGGITGLGSGYTLTSEGIVKFWKQLSFVKDTTLWEQEADIIELLKFKSELDSCGILQKQYDKTGNMTTTLNYDLSDTSYIWTWEEKGNSENIPIEITNWHKNIMEFCKGIEDQI